MYSTSRASSTTSCLTIKGFSPRKEATNDRAEARSFPKSQQAAAVHLLTSRESCFLLAAGHDRLLVRVTSTLTRLTPLSHTVREPRTAIAAHISFQSTHSGARPPWIPAASAKPTTRHPPTPTAARPRRSSWWYVSPSSIPSCAARIAWVHRVQAKGAYARLCVLSDGDAGRCWCWWCCEKEDKSATVRQRSRESMGGIGL